MKEVNFEEACLYLERAQRKRSVFGNNELG